MYSYDVSVAHYRRRMNAMATNILGPTICDAWGHTRACISQTARMLLRCRRAKDDAASQHEQYVATHLHSAASDQIPQQNL